MNRRRKPTKQGNLNGKNKTVILTTFCVYERDGFVLFSYDYPDVIEIMVRGVKGLGDQAVNYLFMLAGDSSRVKVDTHINKCVKAVFGRTLSNMETQELFTRTVDCLIKKYPKLTVARLDNIIWNYYHV